jgi:RNA polymerase sigma-70 factor, ECF subfamily
MVVNHLRLVATPAPCPAVEAGLECLEAFQREFDHLCRTLRRLGIAESEVEDVAQEVFLVLHRNWAEYDASRPLRPYLFGIAFRVAASHRRRIKERPSTHVDIEDASPRPDQALQAKQARAVVLSALERVPLPRRAVLLMHDLDDVSMQEIASELRIPLFTAYSRLRKARKEFERAVRRMRKEVSE